MGRGGATGPSGLVVVDKPAGITSHDVVGRARRLLGTRKVGHAGTLDPMATGVLILGVNRATRLLGHLAGADKTYHATIRLGQGTITDDAEGEITTSPGAGDIDRMRLQAAMAELTGTIAQRPSAVSAIKVNGERAYARVRAGEEVELAPRPVTVSRFALTEHRRATVTGPGGDQCEVVDLDVEVDCSTGTYIRALARDLGHALGSAGHLTMLRRTRVGAFGLADAQPLPPRPGPAGTADAPDTAAAPDTADGVAGALEVMDIDRAARRSFACLDLDAAQARDVGYGRMLRGLALEASPTALFDPQGRFLALYRAQGADARPEAVFVGNQ